jgi:hypothetical protein
MAAGRDQQLKTHGFAQPFVDFSINQRLICRFKRINGMAGMDHRQSVENVKVFWLDMKRFSC